MELESAGWCSEPEGTLTCKDRAAARASGSQHVLRVCPRACPGSLRGWSHSRLPSVSTLSNNLRSSVLKSYRAAGTGGPVSVSSTSVSSRHQMTDASALFWDQFCQSGAALAEQVSGAALAVLTVRARNLFNPSEGSASPPS